MLAPEDVGQLVPGDRPVPLAHQVGQRQPAEPAQPGLTGMNPSALETEAPGPRDPDEHALDATARARIYARSTARLQDGS